MKSTESDIYYDYGVADGLETAAGLIDQAVNLLGLDRNMGDVLIAGFKRAARERFDAAGSPGLQRGNNTINHC